MKEQWILYQTTNLVNGKIYIGVHKLANTKRSRDYLGSGLALQPAIEKYGRENFIRATLAEFSCGADAYAAETEMVTEEFVKRLDTYNLKLGGKGNKGLPLTEEHKAKLSAIHKGKVFSAETRAKLSASGKGKIISDKQKAQIGAAAKGNTYNLGRVFSTEARERMSASQKGKIIKPETRAKISASTIGKVKSAETKAKMKASSKGKIISQEAREKSRVANTGATNPKSLAIIIEDTYYESINIAAKSIGMSAKGLKKRILSTTGKFADYRFATEEEKAEHSLEASRQST